MILTRSRGAAALLSPVLAVVVFALPLIAGAQARPAAPPRAVRPLGRDGHVLNLDFETGDLRDWTASGNAFDKQPVRGDLVSKRRGDMKSNHQGEFWVGGFEVLGDDAVGTLTSAPFKVTHRWASFLIAGGPWQETRVELIRADDHLTYYTFSGYENETLRPVVVDMERHVGREFYIKLIDERKGHWGHINFDHFVFYDGNERPKLADELDPKKVVPPPPVDVVKFAGVKPEEAVAAMSLPQGFRATLFAAEPDVRQPIAMAIDARGRIWVAQGFTYPIRAPEGKGRDSIVIFEDTDNDGRADKRTVFAEGLNLVSGLEVGFGGVWVGAAPYLLFIPDRNGDDKPDGPAEVLLDGFAYQDTHETLNTFTWGPDGWLYGCHGVFTHSNVGKPGASNSERTRINAGIFRYHPTKHKFEVFAEGTSNPWGIDFDEHGQLWAEACVIPHLWHVIQGARYQRQAGQHFNPFTFDDIKQSADHVHYAGNQGPHAGNGRSDAAGGGHAHAGLMVYQGDNWPAEYRGKIFIGNIHGQRINMDVPEPRGSGFVGHHGADFLNFNDRWSQVINFRTGPDGGVYFIDWYDDNQCHHNNAAGHDRTNGRMYKVVYGEPKKPANLGLGALDVGQLIDLATNGDYWHARAALLRLYALGREYQPSSETAARLTRVVNTAPHSARRLRALWTLNAVGGLSEEAALPLLKNAAPHVVGWAIQLMAEDGEVSSRALEEFKTLARETTSPVVRLYLTSAIQRLRLEQRWDALAGLLSHAEDGGDHNLPLMYWYAFEPMANVDAGRMLAMALETKVPNILTFTVRRIAAMEGEAPLAALVANLARVGDEGRQLAILRGVNDALRGRRSVAMPKGWEAVEAKLSRSESEPVRSQVRALAVTFGSRSALASLRQTLTDPRANVNERQAALDSLLNVRSPGLAPVLQQLLDDEKLRGSALRGLAAYDDPNTPKLILEKYNAFGVPEKKDALATLSSRAEFAKALLDAVEGGKSGIARKDISADVVRQLRNLQNAEIDKRVEKVWGIVRSTPEEKLKRIADLKSVVARTNLPPADVNHGRLLFAKTCGQCHTLFGAGGQVGPDITGANRSDLQYVLENVVDPNAVIPIDYQAWVMDTKDGRTVVGLLKKQDEKSVTLVTNTETLVVPRNEVQRLRVSKTSMMPEGLLDTFPEKDIRDLVAYVRSPSQVPMAATAESAKDFFNGKDLTGWDGDREVWSVQNGEIVGKTEKGLKQNNFLKSQVELADFRLVVKMKLVPNEANSGIQFRSEPFEGHEMRGPQADAGAGWWGKLYEENGRGILVDKDFAAFVNKNDWNTYEIVAVGSKVRTALNGHVCVDIDDPKLSRKGVVGLQVHSGGPTEVRFKDVELELNPKFELKTAR